MSNADSRISAPIMMAAGLLALACNFVFTYHLGDEYIGQDSEARVLLTVREMQRDGTLIIPSAPGEDRLAKSPLYIWAVQLAAAFRDEVTPEVGRLPAAMSMLALVLLAAWWARDHNLRYPREDNPDAVGIGLAVLSGLMVATNPDMFMAARRGSPDALFALLCFAAMFCFAQSIEIRRSFYAGRSWRGLILSGYFLIGLATLTKGPLAFLFILPAYALTCFHYRMRKPDWIHAPGLLLAMVIGFWWYGVALALRPNEWTAFWSELITKRFGSEATNQSPPWYYLTESVPHLMPWILPAIYMIWITLRGGHRTPSRLIWSWSAIVGFIGLSFVSSKRTIYLLPVFPGIILLAADALARLDFEHWAGRAFRIFIRAARWVFIAAGLVAGIALGSDGALVLSIVMILIVIALQFHRSRIPYVYARWERTVQGAWMLTLAILFSELVYAREVVPRLEFFSRKAGFIKQINAHAPADAQMVLFGKAGSATYSVYLENLVPRTRDMAELAATAAPNTYLVSDDELEDELLPDPNLVLVTSRVDPRKERLRSGLFKVLKAGAEGSTRTLSQKYAEIPPLKLAVIGNGGADRKGQRDVADRIEHMNETAPLHEVLLIGDAMIPGGASRADFRRGFEAGYRDLLRAGLPFNGMLSNGEAPWLRWLLMHYPIYQMGRKGYYARDFQAGLVRYIALDADGLLHPQAPGESEEQMKWLEAQLTRADGPIWKIVGLDAALAGTVDPAANKAELAAKLLPLFEKYGVDLVMWSGGHWYERNEEPGQRPVMIGAGWSAVSKPPENLPDDARRKAVSGRKPGTVLLEVTPSTLKITASDKDGGLVDEAQLLK